MMKLEEQIEIVKHIEEVSKIKLILSEAMEAIAALETRNTLVNVDTRIGINRLSTVITGYQLELVRKAKGE